MRVGRRVLIVAGVAAGMSVACCWAALAGEKVLELEVVVGPGRGEKVMVVAWAENSKGEFVKTLHMFSKKKKYYRDLTGWSFKSRGKEKSGDVDAVTGATIKWNKSQTVQIPVEQGGINLLDGSHVIRFESRKWKGKHYRTLAVPLPKDYAGGTHAGDGYIKQVNIALKEKAGSE